MKNRILVAIVCVSFLVCADVYGSEIEATEEEAVCGKIMCTAVNWVCTPPCIVYIAAVRLAAWGTCSFCCFGCGSCRPKENSHCARVFNLEPQEE